MKYWQPKVQGWGWGATDKHFLGNSDLLGKNFKYDLK